MNAIRNILAVVDPTCTDQPAVRKAAQLAERFEADLELFACDTQASLSIRRSMHAAHHARDTFVSDLRPVLEALATPLRDRGLNVKTSTRPAVRDLSSALLRHVDGTADLVVKDTHHHSIARRTFLSNTDWQLIRKCEQPLMLTKLKPWSADPCVVAAVDPDSSNDKPATLDRRILDYASLLTRRLCGDLHLAHACLPAAAVKRIATGTAPIVEVIAPESIQLEEQRRKVELATLAKASNIPQENVHVKVGSATEVLVQLAEMLPVDIMVMGALSRSGFDRALIGSTAEDILERLPCDVLIVKTPNFGESLPF